MYMYLLYNGIRSVAFNEYKIAKCFMKKYNEMTSINMNMDREGYIAV